MTCWPTNPSAISSLPTNKIDHLGPFALFMDPEEVEHSRAVFASSSATFQAMYDMLVGILEQYRDKGWRSTTTTSDERGGFLSFIYLSLCDTLRESLAASSC